MSLAGRLISRKESAVARTLVGLFGRNQPVWTPREYGRMAKEGYEANTWVYACVNGTLDAIKRVPWALYRVNDSGLSERTRSGIERKVAFMQKHPRPDIYSQVRKMKALGELEEVDYHPLLALLANPNPQMGGAEFKDAAFGFLLMSGNTYVEAVKPMKSRPPVELWPHRPDRISIIPGEGKFRIASYRYKSGSSYVDLPGPTVCHTKFWHPTNDWYGLSPIEAAAMAVDRDNAAESWNTALLQNGARPSGALVTDAELSEEQKLDLKEAIDERSNPRAAGRPLLLEAGLDWKEMGLTPRDMDWLNSQVWSMKRIAAAYHYPLLLLDPELGGSFSTDYQEARRALYADRALPLMQHLADDFNRWLIPMFGENLLLSYDTDNIEALREGEESLWKRTNDPRMMLNEQREAVGLDPTPDGDVFLIPSTMSRVPADKLSDPTFGVPVAAPGPDPDTTQTDDEAS